VPVWLTDMQDTTVLQPKLTQGRVALAKVLWRAVCGRTACTVREGACGNTSPICDGAPYAYLTTDERPVGLYPSPRHSTI
jgi:hypothetical protein